MTRRHPGLSLRATRRRADDRRRPAAHCARRRPTELAQLSNESAVPVFRPRLSGHRRCASQDTITPARTVDRVSLIADRAPARLWVRELSHWSAPARRSRFCLRCIVRPRGSPQGVRQPVQAVALGVPLAWCRPPSGQPAFRVAQVVSWVVWPPLGGLAPSDRVSSGAGSGVVRGGVGRAYTFAGFPQRETW